MPLHESEVSPSTYSLTAKETPLIDRVEEMGLLKEAADKTVSDQGKLVFLYGEAGIGKTRLTKELRAYARSRGMQILYGRCPALFRMNGVPPYSLWKEVIKDYLQGCTPEQLHRVVGYYPGEISKIVPEIRQKLITFSESPPLSPDQERDRLFEAVSQFITNISKATPLVVVLDDLQWADPSSLLLLHYLARGIYRENLFLLGAYRDTEVEEKHPLSLVLTELNRARLLQSAQLQRMSSDEVTEMIKQILGQSDVPKEFCECVYEKTNGNPFFVEEVITSLKEEGVIIREENKYKIGEVSEIEFPKTVKDVLKARLGRLDEECQNVLTLASFIGNDFTFEALREVTGIEEGKLLEMMERMLKTGLLKCRVRHGEDICSFADVLIREVLYEEVSPLRRKKLHGVVGCALEKVYAKKIDDHLGELAAHFLESGDKDKALDYFLKAGEKAAKIYANNEAASYYCSAFKILEEKNGDPREKVRVLEVLGDINELVGDYDACMKYWNEALLLWQQLMDKEKVARLYRKISNILWIKLGDTEKAKEYQAKALEILEAQPESIELASLYADIAEMYWHSGVMDKAAAFIDKAIKLAKKLDAYEILANSYIVLAKIVSMKNRKEAGECSEEALRIALNHRYTKTTVEAYANCASPHFGAESGERRLKCAEEGYELAKKVGAISAQSHLGAHLAGMYFGEGEIDTALLLIEDAVALNRKTGNLHDLPLFLVPLGQCYMVLGEWEKSEKYYNEALMIAQKTNHVPAASQACLYIINLLFKKGEYAKARELAEKMYNQAEKAGVKLVQAYDAYPIAVASIEMGELEKAENYINIMQQLFQELKIDFSNVIDGLRGQLFRAQKRWNESIEYFEKSIEHKLPKTESNLYMSTKYGIWEYAQVYVERNQEGDKPKAISLLNQALEVFQKMHAKKDIDKVKAQIIYLQTGRRVPLEPTAPVATGYAPLDKLLCGGIPSNFTTVVTSPSCDERDSLIKSFLETGAKKGEPTFYVTIDPSLAGFLAEEHPSNFRLFVCNPQAEAVVKNAPNVFTLKGVENLTNINIALTQAIRKLDPASKSPRRICIDLLSDILLQHRSVQTRKWLTELLTQLRSTGFTTLAAINPQMHPSEELHAILSLFEGEINIREAETDKGLTRFLKIKRLSNQKYLKDETPLTEE